MAKPKARSPSTGRTTAPGAEKGKRVPISEVQQVQELMDLKQEIDALKAENPEVFMTLADLVDRYNSKLDEATKEVKSLGVSCGPFENYSVKIDYNPELMLDELGEEAFLACGGSVAKVSQYTVDKKAVEAAIASGKIPQACIDEFKSVTRSYHSPKPITL